MPYIYVGVFGTNYFAALWDAFPANPDGSWTNQLYMPNTMNVALPATLPLYVACVDVEFTVQDNGMIATTFRTLTQYDLQDLEILIGDAGPRSIGDYVAMGDSYSSGEANSPYDAGTNLFNGGARLNGCHRSADAWPRLIRHDVHHLACSGALVSDFYEGQEKAGPDDVGQLERLRRIHSALTPRGRRVETVTITIGRNDVGFGDHLGACYTGPRECLRNERRWQGDIDALLPQVADLLNQIKAINPYGRVALVGYPRLFPEIHEETVGCGWLTSNERTRANSFAARLDTVLQSAAENAGVMYISTLHAFDGHELCSPDSWVTEFTPVRYPNQELGHPNKLGQQRLQSIVKPALEQE